MAEFTATIQDRQELKDTLDAVELILDAMKRGQRVRIKITRIRDSKTAPQLGYYYGCLLPAIHDWRIEAGDTITVEFCGREVEREPTKADTHELLKAVAALVGEDGAQVDVADMDVHTMSKFIDHVLQVCVQLSLNMNAIEARRPSQ